MKNLMNKAIPIAVINDTNPLFSFTQPMTPCDSLCSWCVSCCVSPWVWGALSLFMDVIISCGNNGKGEMWCNNCYLGLINCAIMVSTHKRKVFTMEVLEEKKKMMVRKAILQENKNISWAVMTTPDGNIVSCAFVGDGFESQ